MTGTYSEMRTRNPLTTTFTLPSACAIPTLQGDYSEYYETEDFEFYLPTASSCFPSEFGRYHYKTWSPGFCATPFVPKKVTTSSIGGQIDTTAYCCLSNFDLITETSVKYMSGPRGESSQIASWSTCVSITTITESLSQTGTTSQPMPTSGQRLTCYGRELAVVWQSTDTEVASIMNSQVSQLGSAVQTSEPPWESISIPGWTGTARKIGAANATASLTGNSTMEKE